MTTAEGIRIDKYLWAVRIYKTRSLAAEACRKGKIIINNIAAKPSHIVKTGEIITVKKLPSLYTYRVLEPTGNRVSAKLAGNFAADLTPDEEKSKNSAVKYSGFGYRPKGHGRPTKRDRRDIDRLSDNLSF